MSRTLRVRLRLLCLVAALLSAGMANSSLGQVALDTTFGSSGVATFDFGGAYDDIQGMSIAPNGKIWAVGTGGTSNRFAVARLTSAGQLDNTFSGDGKLIIGASSGSAGVQALPGGKVMLGVPRLTPEPRGFQAIQLTDAGAFDSTFGTSGAGFIETTGSQVYIESLIVQPDNKVLVSGYDFMADGWNFVLTRFLANGTPDSTFGTGGRVITDFSRTGVQSPSDYASAFVLQPDGKILAGGSSTTSATSGSRVHAVARYMPDGTLDSTFGDQGKATFTFSTTGTQSENVGAMVLQSDGKILGSSNYGSTTALFRLNANGSVDTTFGTAGQIVSPTNAPWRDSQAMVVDSQGRILLGGSGAFSVTRLTPTGAVDSTFGTNGTFDINIGTTWSKYVSKLEFDTDGKLVVGGHSTISPNVDSNWNVARLTFGPPPPTTSVTLMPTFDVKGILGTTRSITEGETGLFAGLGFDASNPEERPIFEFSLASIPAGATITSATLKLDPYASSGSPRLEVQAFAGDGLASITDITSTGQVAATTGAVSASDPSIDISLTPAILQSYLGTSNYLGLRIRSLDLPLYVGFGSTEATFGVPPQLLLSYSLPTGDFNNDGIVNGSDYVVWRNGMGTKYTQSDYNVWRSHFGQTVGSGSATIAAVPEAGSMVLFISAVLLVGGSSRRQWV